MSLVGEIYPIPVSKRAHNILIKCAKKYELNDRMDNKNAEKAIVEQMDETLTEKIIQYFAKFGLRVSVKCIPGLSIYFTITTLPYHFLMFFSL